MIVYARRIQYDRTIFKISNSLFDFTLDRAIVRLVIKKDFLKSAIIPQIFTEVIE